MAVFIDIKVSFLGKFWISGPCLSVTMKLWKPFFHPVHCLLIVSLLYRNLYFHVVSFFYTGLFLVYWYSIQKVICLLHYLERCPLCSRDFRVVGFKLRLWSKPSFASTIVELAAFYPVYVCQKLSGHRFVILFPGSLFFPSFYLFLITSNCFVYKIQLLNFCTEKICVFFLTS